MSLVEIIFLGLIIALSCVGFVLLLIFLSKEAEIMKEEYVLLANNLGLEYKAYEWSLFRLKYDILRGNYKNHYLEIYRSTPIYAPNQMPIFDKLYFFVDGKLAYKVDTSKPRGVSRVSSIVNILKDLEAKKII